MQSYFHSSICRTRLLVTPANRVSLCENRNVETVLSKKKSASFHTATRRYCENTYVKRIVEPHSQIQAVNSLNFGLLQIPSGNIQILGETSRVVTLGDNGNVSLRGPSEQDLCCGLAVLLGGGFDNVVLEQGRCVVGDVHVQFLETQGTERGVCGDDDALALDVFDELLLLEVRVMLNLECGGTNASMAQEVHNELDAEVANTNAASEFLVDQRLHGLPCFLDSGIAECDFAVCVPTGRVALGRVNPFECDGEVNQIKVKVFKTKILELLAGNGFDFVAVVEGVPELGDDE